LDCSRVRDERSPPSGRVSVSVLRFLFGGSPPARLSRGRWEVGCTRPPTAKGVTFAFDICFENLTPPELGALLWGLQVGDQDAFRLKVGMGKPLGLGSVRTHPELNLSQRVARYRRLLTEWTAQEGPGTTDINRFVPDFETMIWTNLPEKAKGDAKDFRSLSRIQALRHLLHWHGPDPDATRYMSLDAKEYRDRPVLPTPGEVMQLAPPRPLPRATREEAIVGSEVEAVILKLEGSTVVVKVNNEEVHLPYAEMPEPNLDQKRCERRYPPGNDLRVKVLDRTKKGKLLITAKGVRQS
jgi:hypothetical protein